MQQRDTRSDQSVEDSCNQWTAFCDATQGLGIQDDAKLDGTNVYSAGASGQRFVAWGLKPRALNSEARSHC